MSLKIHLSFRRPVKLQDDAARGGLAAAALTNKTKRVAAVNVEGHAVNCFYGAYFAPEDPSTNRKILLEIVDLEDDLLFATVLLNVALFSFGRFNLILFQGISGHSVVPLFRYPTSRRLHVPVLSA